MDSQELILDHYHHPKNHGALDAPTHQATSSNLSCGDSLSVDIAVKNGIIEAIGWDGTGCALSQASASIISEHVLGKTTEETRNISKETLLSLLGISPSPTRLKCTLLSIDTIHRALSKDGVKKEG